MPDGGLAHEAGPVRHELPQRDRLAGGIGRLELREVLGHGRVEVQFAAFDQLHDADVGEQLGDRADAIDRFRRRRHLVGGVRIAEAPGPDDGLVVHQGDREPGQLLVRHLTGNELVECPDAGGVFFRRRNAGLSQHSIRQRADNDDSAQSSNPARHPGRGLHLIPPKRVRGQCVQRFSQLTRFPRARPRAGREMWTSLPFHLPSFLPILIFVKGTSGQDFFRP